MTGQTERIAHKIGYILHFRTLVVMRQDDRMPLCGKIANLLLEANNRLRLSVDFLENRKWEGHQ